MTHPPDFMVSIPVVLCSVFWITLFVFINSLSDLLHVTFNRLQIVSSWGTPKYWDIGSWQCNMLNIHDLRWKQSRHPSEPTRLQTHHNYLELGEDWITRFNHTKWNNKNTDHNNTMMSNIEKYDQHVLNLMFYVSEMFCRRHFVPV